LRDSRPRRLGRHSRTPFSSKFPCLSQLDDTSESASRSQRRRSCRSVRRQAARTSIPAATATPNRSNNRPGSSARWNRRPSRSAIRRKRKRSSATSGSGNRSKRRAEYGCPFTRETALFPRNFPAAFLSRGPVDATTATNRSGSSLLASKRPKNAGGDFHLSGAVVTNN
jgi:hypothetical protein